MPSELDRAFNSIMDALTAPGAPLETEMLARGNHAVPVLKNAPVTLRDFFAHYCAQHGDLPFLVDGDLRLSFAEVHALAEQVADGLLTRHAIRKGDRVGIAARNSANWIIAYMGVIIAGGCATLINAWGVAEEMVAATRMVDCRLLIADSPRAARLQGSAIGCPLVVMGHGDPLSGLAGLLGETGTGGSALPPLAPYDLATVVFTSGSTGVSKGACSDHRAVVHAALSYAAQSLMMLAYLQSRGEASPLQPCALVNVPLFHVTGEVPLFLQSFALGRKLVNMPKWDALEAMRLIEAEKVTYFVGVPLMSHEIATHPERTRFDLSSCTVMTGGGAPRPVDHVRRIREALPTSYPVLGYGLTETNAVGCANFNENYLARPESTGPASRPLVELAIIDEHGAHLLPGSVGEICFRTVCNFSGFWNNPEATAQAFTADGFVRTGDLGHVDADGYLTIVDRKKDIILRGGENISCLEVEQAIYAHPAIAEACVFGLPDPHFGEVPGAVYLVRPGHAIDADGLRAFLAEHIAPFKMPARMWQVDAPLPRLGTEKVDRRAIKARYSAAT